MTAAAMTAAAAAVQPADIPKELQLQKCPGSGAIDSFLGSIQPTDAVSYRIYKEEWEAAKNDGAVAGEIVLYSDSQADCDALHGTPSGQIASLSAPLAISVVLKFKDEKTAAKAYGTESIGGFRESDISSGGISGITTGAATGLGPRSVQFGGAALGSFYLAMWQNKTFMLQLTAVGVDGDQSKKIAANENARVDRQDTAEKSDKSPFVEPSPLAARGVTGQAINLTYATITVASVNLNAPPPVHHPRAQPGNRFVKVVIDVVFHRTLRGGITWELADSQGNSYGEGTYDESLTNVPTAPGDTEHVDSWFEVPQTATSLTLTVKLGTDSAMVSLG